MTADFLSLTLKVVTTSHTGNIQSHDVQMTTGVARGWNIFLREILTLPNPNALRKKHIISRNLTYTIFESSPRLAGVEDIDPLICATLI